MKPTFIHHRSGSAALRRKGLVASATLSLCMVILAGSPPDQAHAQQREENRPQKGERGKGQRKGQEKGQAKTKRGGGPPHVFTGPPPAHPFDLILVRPTDRSITASLMAYEPMEAYLAYRAAGTASERKTAVRPLEPKRPQEFVIEGLDANRAYEYTIHTRPKGTAAYQASQTHRFQTQRAPGSPFRFAVQADSHLDQASRPAVYEKTLASILAERPDFLVDLGDTFMTDKYPDFHDALPQYFAQRYYFGLIGTSVPCFLVLGNHDGERLERLDGNQDSMSSWSNRTRKMLFPNPVPDRFYTGNTEEKPQLGLLQDYYAWEWGDALFVVLDPFWYTERRGGRQGGTNWSRTLGERQYRWLETTLTRSRARFKFVFLHHLVGGLDSSARGGSEAARLYEWGGRNAEGENEFARQRPGWAKPIHELLVANHVSIVFHGHDHFFAHQTLDGVVYLMVPQPGTAAGDRLRGVEEYGYRDGRFLASPGHVRVQVNPESAVVDYVRTSTGRGDAKANPEPGYTFTIRP
ncbi:MAG: metallophosphoesterase [Isosphaeraceae bacterium]